jgi:curved DNA-binding protein CbpA
MDGQFKDDPLAELIQEISDARLSGALRLAFERVKGVVYFDAGRVIAAASNLRAFRLTEILRGVAEGARLFAIVGEGASDEQASAALVRAGLLDEAGLRKARERQAGEVLKDLLRRAGGEWSFDPRVRLAPALHTSPNATQLLVESAREVGPEVVARALSDDSETLAPAPGAQEKLESGAVALSPPELFVLTRVYEPTNLRYVLAVSGLPEDETRRAVYALALGGLITRGRKPRALPAELLRVKAQQSAAKAAPAPPQQPQPTPAPSEPEPQATPTHEAEEDPRELIEDLLALARAETHYSVLGVARSATGSDLKRAYYALARRLHPDRLRRAADPETQQRIDAAFAKISRAYDVLKDAGQRASYDLKLEKLRASQPAADSTRASAPSAEAPRKDEPPPRKDVPPSAARPADSPAQTGANAEAAKSDGAEQKFRQGLAAYARNDFAAARLLLGEAARLAPKHAAYRANYGRALARERATMRQAESELLAAISLDALDASFHIMLAELYVNVGLRRKAAAQLERALALEPSNAAARSMLEELRRSIQ